jgi:MFS family permease
MGATISNVFSLEALLSIPYDGQMLMLCKGLRMFGFGFLAVILVIYLEQIGFSTSETGLLFTLTLLGDAVISIFLTTHADKYGRKFCLFVGSFLSIFTSLVFISQTNFWILLIAAIVGVISPSGSEVGPFMAIEISSMAQVSEDRHRTKIMSWYNLVGCFSSASGALLCGFITNNLVQEHQFTLLNASKFSMCVYAIVQVFQSFFIYLLRSNIEVPSLPQEAASDKASASPSSAAASSSPSFLGLHKSKFIVLHLSLLFMIDSFAGSFVLQSMISNWFFVTYKTNPAVLGSIIFFCNLVAGVSALFAATLADHIGLVLTMVVTHLPSNVLLILVPLMPSELLSILMICARYCISQMDVPTRNAYVQGVVDPDERSAANGITNVSKLSVPTQFNAAFYFALVLLHCTSHSIYQSIK